MNKSHVVTVKNIKWHYSFYLTKWFDFFIQSYTLSFYISDTINRGHTSSRQDLVTDHPLCHPDRPPITILVILSEVISVSKAIFVYFSLRSDSKWSGLLPSLLWKWLRKMSHFHHSFVWQESPEIGELNVSKVIASRRQVISQYLACFLFFFVVVVV